MTALIACYQLYNVDSELKANIDANETLASRFHGLRREPISLRPYDPAAGEQQ